MYIYIYIYVYLYVLAVLATLAAVAALAAPAALQRPHPEEHTNTSFCFVKFILGGELVGVGEGACQRVGYLPIYTYIYLYIPMYTSPGLDWALLPPPSLPRTSKKSKFAEQSNVFVCSSGWGRPRATGAARAARAASIYKKRRTCGYI